MHDDDTVASGDTHENAAQEVVAVDADGTEERVVNRLDAHTGDGVRHRAFTCLLFDRQDRLLLAQRSPVKRLWDTYWDGTVASHPDPDQSQQQAARERLQEELGLAAGQYENLRRTDRFEYKRYYYEEGVEWEVCSVLKATIVEGELTPEPDEIGGLLWVDYEHLHAKPRFYRQLRLCPWFEIAMRRDFRSD